MKNTEVPMRFILARNILAFLDILIAILITITARYLKDTAFGRASLTFGIIMITMTTILKISHNWIFTKDYPLNLKNP